MATQRKRSRPKVRFELSRGGIGGIAVICFCLLLWMFLFGVWAGQSLLKPSEPLTTDFQAGKVQEEQPVIQLEDTKKTKPR